MANKYNAEGYFSPVEYEIFTRIERKERQKQYRPLVYICSPYSQGCINENIENARRYSRTAALRGYIPLAPHLLFPQFLDDCDKQERQLAIRMNNILLGKCHELWICGTVVSKGMKQEIRRAGEKGIPIRWFNEEMEELK